MTHTTKIIIIVTWIALLLAIWPMGETTNAHLFEGVREVATRRVN